MDNSKIVVLGANGQLGLALQAQYPGSVAGDRDMLDITDKQAVENFDWSNTEIILNAAAYTNVDGAETPDGAELAQKINADGVRNLADIAKKNDITLVHISSDYVFDGSKKDHLETEEFSPLSVYGRTKAEADAAVATVPKNYVLRTSWLIGNGKNFVGTMLELGAKGVSPTVVDDQFGRLTFTDELVRAIAHLLLTGAPYGVYNVTNSGPVKSWAEITEEIFADAGFENLTVNHISTAEYYSSRHSGLNPESSKKPIAPRPTNSDLNLDKLHSTGFVSQDWQEELINYINLERHSGPDPESSNNKMTERSQI